MDFYRARLSFRRLRAEVRHHLLGHQFQMLEHQIAWHFADLGEIDQYTGMQFFGIVGKFLDYRIDATCEDDTSLYQIFEGWTLWQRLNTDLKAAQVTPLAHVAWWG